MEQQIAKLRLCLESLAPRAREIVELRYQQAHNPPEIARRVNWSVDAVHVAGQLENLKVTIVPSPTGITVTPKKAPGRR